MISRVLTWWQRVTAPKPPPEPEPLPFVQIAQPALITGDLLRRLGWATPDAYAPHLAEAAKRFGIHGPVRVAAFLAQIGHESGGGRFRREIWGPTAAQSRYEGRRDLGNYAPGDGKRFMGRGLIQITGRANTTAARDALKPGIELEAFCDWLESVEGASVSAAWWWATHGCNDLADSGDFERLTRRINGGLNGHADRAQRWDAAKALLFVR